MLAGILFCKSNIIEIILVKISLIQIFELFAKEAKMRKLVGYVRVSTSQQSLDIQIKAL